MERHLHICSSRPLQKTPKVGLNEEYMSYCTKSNVTMFGILAGMLAVANNVVAQGGDGTETEDEPTEASASLHEIGAGYSAPASGSNVAGPRDDVHSLGHDVGFKKKEAPFRPYAVTLNALTLFVLRPSVNFEVLPAVHHSIIVNPSFQAMSRTEKWSFMTLGIDLGYRYYTGKKGANGLFIGPSLVYNYFNVKWSHEGDNENVFSTYGLAIDLGGQHVFDNGLTIGGGAGVRYFGRTATDFPPIHPEVHVASLFATKKGFSPRILFTLGYSF